MKRCIPGIFRRKGGSMEHYNGALMNWKDDNSIVQD
jgi:hypothetical protein